MLWPDWSIALPFLSGIMGAIIVALFARHKNKAEAGKADKEGEATLSVATLEWAKQLRETLEGRIEKLQIDHASQYSNMATRVTALERENLIIKAHNALLIRQLDDNKITPVPAPHFDFD